MTYGTREYYMNKLNMIQKEREYFEYAVKDYITNDELDIMDLIMTADIYRDILERESFAKKDIRNFKECDIDE